jgi:hypothetical protein
VSLAGYQDALARLLVDTALRRRWAAGELELDRATQVAQAERVAEREQIAQAERVGQAEGVGWAALGIALDGPERAALAALDPLEVERVAQSLLRKRRRAIEALVPHSARLWPGLGDAHQSLLERRPAQVRDLDPTLGPAASELLRLLPALVHAAQIDLAAPVWTGDLLRLELARACGRLAGGVRSLRCAYPVHELLLACDRGWVAVLVEVGAHAYRVEGGTLRWRTLEGSA